MEWSNVLVSAAVGGMVSVLVTLLTVSTVTVRQARALRRDNARQEIAALALAARLEARKYLDGPPEHAARASTVWHQQDAVDAAAYFHAAEPLPMIRRALIRRRLRRLYGTYAVETAELVSPGDKGEEVFLRALLGRKPDQITPGLVHAAYAAEPRDPALCRKLDRQLGRLGRAW